MRHYNVFRKKYLCSVIGLMIVICGVFNFWQNINKSGHVRTLKSNHDKALIVWWNFMLRTFNHTISTEAGNCQITGNHSLWREANVNLLHSFLENFPRGFNVRFHVNISVSIPMQIILFYGSTIDPLHLPLPRPKNQLWGLLHEESPRNVPFIPYTEFLQFFNYTSTFSRYSDLPFPTFHLPSYEDLVGHQYVVPVANKSKNDNQALVVFFSSSCNTLTAREDYIQELMQFINIDSFGSCLNNRDMPERQLL